MPPCNVLLKQDLWGGLKNTQRWEFLVLFGSTGAQASLGDLRCPRQSLEGIILGIYIIGILQIPWSILSGLRWICCSLQDQAGVRWNCCRIQDQRLHGFRFPADIQINACTVYSCINLDPRFHSSTCDCCRLPDQPSQNSNEVLRRPWSILSWYEVNFSQSPRSPLHTSIWEVSEKILSFPPRDPTMPRPEP